MQTETYYDSKIMKPFQFKLSLHRNNRIFLSFNKNIFMLLKLSILNLFYTIIHNSTTTDSDWNHIQTAITRAVTIQTYAKHKSKYCETRSKFENQINLIQIIVL